MRALARRGSGGAARKLRHGDLVLDLAAHEVTLGDEQVDLTAGEFALLRTLLENRGRVLSRVRLQESLYGWGDAAESNVVEVHVHHLRRKLGEELIRTHGIEVANVGKYHGEFHYYGRLEQPLEAVDPGLVDEWLSKHCHGWLVRYVRSQDPPHGVFDGYWQLFRSGSLMLVPAAEYRRRASAVGNHPTSPCDRVRGRS